MHHWVIYVRIMSYILFSIPFLTIISIYSLLLTTAVRELTFCKNYTSWLPSSSSCPEKTNLELTFAKAELLITLNTATQSVTYHCTAKPFSTMSSLFSQFFLVLSNFLSPPIHNFAQLFSESFILSSICPRKIPAKNKLVSPLHCQSSPEDNLPSHSLTT